MLQISTITDELLSSFGFYAMILALEFVAISYLTGQERLKTKVNKIFVIFKSVDVESLNKN